MRIAILLVAFPSLDAGVRESNVDLQALRSVQGDGQEVLVELDDFLPVSSALEADLTDRRLATEAFRKFLKVSKAKKVRAQTNDLQLLLMLYEFAKDVKAEAIPFHHVMMTQHGPSGAIVRRKSDADKIFAHHHEPVGDCVVEVNGEVVATAGFLSHYNPPYADIFMEVAEPHRRRGYGPFAVQEAMRMCYQAGKRPAARCSPTNTVLRIRWRRPVSCRAGES